MRADSHEAGPVRFSISRALRARSGFGRTVAAWCRPENAQGFRPQGRVSGVLSHGEKITASRESRYADIHGKNRPCACLSVERVAA